MTDKSESLISIANIRETRLGRHISPWSAYRLIRTGKLNCIRIGRRVFVTPQLIEEFFAKGGEQ